MSSSYSFNAETCQQRKVTVFSFLRSLSWGYCWWRWSSALMPGRACLSWWWRFFWHLGRERPEEAHLITTRTRLYIIGSDYGHILTHILTHIFVVVSKPQSALTTKCVCVCTSVQTLTNIFHAECSQRINSVQCQTSQWLQRFHRFPISSSPGMFAAAKF